jgi:hypothetical protein
VRRVIVSEFVSKNAKIFDSGAVVLTYRPTGKESV